MRRGVNGSPSRSCGPPGMTPSNTVSCHSRPEVTQSPEGKGIHRSEPHLLLLTHHQLRVCSHFVLDRWCKLSYNVLSPAPRGARSRGVARGGSRTRSWAGARNPAPGGPGPRRAAPDPAPGSGNGASGQGGRSSAAAPVRLKEPCARGHPALAFTYTVEPDASRATPRSTLKAGAERLRPEGAAL